MRLKYTIGRVVLVLVGPLLRHSLLSLPLEEKLILMAISPTIATMKPHKLQFRLGLGLLTWFLSHPILQGKPNASHMCARIIYTHMIDKTRVIPLL
jgi:hypothetical protein